MSAHRIRRPAKSSNTAKGIFDVPASGRVARRGSTRVLVPETPDVSNTGDHGSSGRGRTQRDAQSTDR